jgi:hypothetical protein
MKDGLKQLLHHDSASGVRRILDSRELSKEARRLESASARSGIPVFAATDSKLINVALDTGTLFILGSGASVLEMSQAQVEQMAQAATVGFGAWALHDFVPTAYGLSPAKGLVDYERIVSETMGRPDIVAQRPEVLFLRPVSALDDALLASLPADHRGSTRLYGRFNPFATAEGALQRDLALFHRRASTAHGGAIVADAGATVVRLLSLAVVHQIPRVVLVGVDMNGSPYFFEQEPSYLANNNFSRFDTGQVTVGSHDTATLLGRRIPVVDMIRLLATVSSQLHGGRVFVGSKSSTLAKILPVFDW